MHGRKRRERSKGDMYAKVELVYDRNWHSEVFHTMGIFFILQSLTKRIKIARRFIGELFFYAFFFSSFSFSVAK